MPIEETKSNSHTLKKKRQTKTLVPLGFSLTQSEVIDLPIKKLEKLIAEKNYQNLTLTE